ncbi:MAG: hypothetical protein BAJATHORv1_30172 [Candidatus Thorarchaeota archaeon]|nr:MAG: hypothetical protein BAJATHORv1_30172 [Candidatus Thorarchaeota archaeon]
MKLGVVLGRGGHTTETLGLVNLLGSFFEYIYFIDILDRLVKKKIRYPGTILPLLIPRYLPSDSRILSVIRTLTSFALALVFLLLYRPRAVISCGSGLTIPVFQAARILSIKTIYVESIARVETLSGTGRLLLGKTDLFFSQWSQLAEKHSEIEYGGLIL